MPRLSAKKVRVQVFDVGYVVVADTDFLELPWDVCKVVYHIHDSSALGM